MSTIPAAVAAINTLLKMGNNGSPQTFLTVANVGDITGPTLQTDVVDVTSQSTGVPWSQKFPTLLNAGDLSFPCFFVPNSTSTGSELGHEELLYAFVNRVQHDWQLVFPDVGATTWSFQGWVTKFNMKAPVKGVLTADVMITLTGVAEVVAQQA